MYNVSNNLIDYELYNPIDPSMGIIVHYYFGDRTGCFENRKPNLVFICHADIDNIPNSVCYAGYKGADCQENATFSGEKSWYDAITMPIDNESVIYEFETMYGYNVTYDLNYIVDGYLNGKYYKLENGDGSDSIYFNLFDSFGTTVDKDLCLNNAETYEYGYIFETGTDDRTARCISLGRDPPKIELYDDTLPTEGIKVSFENVEHLTYINNG